MMQPDRADGEACVAVAVYRLYSMVLRPGESTQPLALATSGLFRVCPCCPLYLARDERDGATEQEACGLRGPFLHATTQDGTWRETRVAS